MCTPRTPHNSVTAVVRLNEAIGQIWEVLLMKCLPLVPLPELEPSESIYYKLPGGKAERIPPTWENSVGKWEDPITTARRELSEESGLKAKKKTRLIHVYREVCSDGHVKHGFCALRSECFGRLHKGVRVDSSTRIVGHLWVPFDRAIELIAPTDDNASQHNVLLATQQFIEGGHFGPRTS